jgi:hypothetical protein
MPTTWVFFIRHPRDVSWHKAVRLAWRGSHRTLTSKLIALLTRCEFIHVAVGSSEVVMTVSAAGARYYPFQVFVEYYPGVTWAVAVPSSKSPHIEPRLVRPCSRLPMLLRWITCGFWPSHDCVTSTREVLRSVGVEAPRTVTTPGQMFDWLRSEGYEFREVA